MQKKKKNFIGKIVKEDYNDELETVLEKKQFGESEKNILLNILYKIENSYKDYAKVKRNVATKEESIKRLIKIIKNDCKKITLVKPTEEKSEILGNKAFIIDYENKEIICYPVERKMLYCICKIGAKPKIITDKYFLIDRTLSNLINIGNCINTVEIIRDFNGFSWTTIKSEIESIEYNIIYQNLRMLVGYNFLEKWLQNKEYIIDYFELFKFNLIEKYGKKRANNIIELISKLSILLERKYNRNFARQLKSTKEEIFLKLEKTENMEEFIKKITKEKKEITEKIGKIDEILNNKNKLKKEFDNRNQELSMEHKIFNIKVLKIALIKEREKYIEKLEELNELLNPKKFIKYKNELLDKKKYLELVYCKNAKNKIEELILELQKTFLECFKIKINKAQTRNEIIDLFYQFRYYEKIPLNDKINIRKNKKLEENIQNVEEILLKKAYSLKIINNWSNSSKLNLKVVKNIFETRIIDLTDIFIEIVKEKDKLFMKLYDEDVLDNKFEIDTSDRVNIKNMEVKLNKKIKLFI